MQVAKDKEIMDRDNHEDDVFMPKDNTVILEDGEMNEIDRELEEFKLQMILPDDQTTEEPSKGCCASEPKGPCF